MWRHSKSTDLFMQHSSLFFFLNTELELENMSYCWTWLITLLYQRLLFSAIVNQISIGSCWKYLEKIQFTLSVFFLNPSQTLLHLQYTLFQIQCHSLLPSAFCIKNYWEKNRHKKNIVTDGYLHCIQWLKKKTVDMSFETKNFDLGIQLVIDIPDEFWNKFWLLT